MDEKVKYECPDCGEITEVEVGAAAPVCESCGTVMTPVKEVEGEEGLNEEDWEEEEWEEEE